jgi:Rieske Fe-S protein
LEGGFLAFSAICPHLSCIVNWNEMLKKFECPCHGAKFNRNGEVLEGPPPRPLDLYKLQIVEEKLVIDTASLIERRKFEPSQVIKG